MLYANVHVRGSLALGLSPKNSGGDEIGGVL
jgi:hypothetical protein